MYLAMEQCDASLAELLAAEGLAGWDVPTRRRVFEQMCAGVSCRCSCKSVRGQASELEGMFCAWQVECLHTNGLVHLRLRPSNVFINDTMGARVVKIGDAGLGLASLSVRRRCVAHHTRVHRARLPVCTSTSTPTRRSSAALVPRRSGSLTLRAVV